MPEEAKWYIVHTYSGYENKVASNLEKTIENRGLGELIQEVIVPTETVTEMKDNKKCTVERKIFPGYVRSSARRRSGRQKAGSCRSHWPGRQKAGSSPPER